MFDTRSAASVYAQLDKEAKRHGLTRPTRRAFAVLGVWLHSLGLALPVITSGRRSASKQERMRAAWDRGQRAGLVARPALHSAHTRGEAFDVLRLEGLATMGALAQYVGVRWGGNFTERDDVHFDMGNE